MELNKKNLLLFIIAFVLIVPVIVLKAAPPAFVPGKMVSQSYHPDRVLVKFRSGVGGPQAMSDIHKENLSIAREFQVVSGLKLLTIPPGQTLEDVISRLSRNPHVEYVEPDYLITQNTTDDTYVSQLWAFDNTAQAVNGVTGSSDADMNVFEAWSNTGVSGDSSMVIAVIDSGVKYDHPDLANNMWVNPGEVAGDGIDNDGNGYIDDVHGINAITGSGDPMDDNFHGTHVAGTIAAVGNNASGVTGVVQNAKIIACKSLSAAGSGATSDAITCLNYLHKMKVDYGINIILSNNSWGGTGSSTALESAIQQHMQDGILFVAAAGNDNVNNDSSPHYPSSYVVPNLISVAATDQSDTRASFSNYGRYSVHVGAPGVNIYSTTLADAYTFANGTSMATPNVSGIIALLKANNPALDWKALKNLVISSGTPVAALSTNTTTGRRVRAWDSDGTGALTCSNQTVQAQLSPQQATITKVSGAKLGLAYMNINCEAGAGSSVVTTTGPSAVADLALSDNGLSYDAAANDGIYSAYWTAPATAGSYTLTFSNGQSLTVSVIANSSTLKKYRAPVSITYAPRSNAQAFSPMAYGGGGYISLSGYATYYPIPFGGGAGVNTIYGTFNGNNLMNVPTAGQDSLSNTELANDVFTSMVASYWDDLDLSASGDGIRGWWSASGTVYPYDGELVFEWKGTQKVSGNPVDVQIVYSANSSDIEMHYIAVDNAGDSATVGIQVDPVRATQQSYNSANITANSAWRWSLDTGVPTANAGVDQNATGNGLVTLSGSGTDPDGGALSYQWTQLSGSLVSVSNANTETATFTAPNTTETLVFELTVTDDAAQSVTDLININVTAASTGGVLALTNTAYSVSENGSTATITVSRTGGSSGAVSVDYATADANATIASDYTAASGTLNWSDADSTDKTFTIPIINDSVYEMDETVAVSLSNVAGSASLGTSIATLTITDDDTAVPGTLSFSPATYSVSESAVTASVTVTRTGGSDDAVSVNYVTTDGSATAGSDYTSASGTLSWTHGDSATKSFNITILDDGIYESSELINLGLDTVTGGAMLGSSSGTLTITDDDAVPGTLSLSNSTYTVAENGTTATITVSRTGGSDGAVSVNYVTSNDSATAGSDYTATSGTLNWGNGVSGDMTFDIPIIDDVAYEGDETVTISLNTFTGGATAGTSSATLTITEDDAAPAQGVLGLSSASYTQAENGGAITITVERIGGSSGAVSVQYVTADGTATAGSDYTTASGTLSWADTEVGSKIFTVNITDDAVYESDETVAISLNTFTGGATAGTSSATLTISNDDPLPNAAPDTPTLISLANNSVGVDGSSVTFEWNRVTDPDGDTVTYQLHYCTDAGFTMGCGNPPVVASFSMQGLLGGGMGLAMLGMVATGNRRQRLLQAAAMMTTVLVLSACGGEPEPEPPVANPNVASQTVTGLASGTTYYWKVVASDGNGGSSASEVWQLTTN